MVELTTKEMTYIEGGELSFGLIVGIGALAVFIIGVIDGYVNPVKCNN